MGKTKGMAMADEKLRVGVIGAGMIANAGHIPGWKNVSADVEVVAVANPTGRAIKQAPAVTSRVPDIRGRTPKWASANRGVHWVSVKKSRMDTSPKKLTVSESRT